MRLLDLALIFLTLPWILLVILAVCLVIKLDSPGPVFFTQDRVGSRLRCINGEWFWEITTFKIVKFRSMFHGADQRLHEAHIRAYARDELAKTGENRAAFKMHNDPRITRSGRWLRKTSIDELPQVWNIVRGQMSLVGPRPVPIYEVEQYKNWHFERLAARPGLTGLWQVQGRGNVTFDEMIGLDVEYVRQQSLWSNIKILALTIPAVIGGKGAL